MNLPGKLLNQRQDLGRSGMSQQIVHGIWRKQPVDFGTAVLRLVQDS